MTNPGLAYSFVPLCWMFAFATMASSAFVTGSIGKVLLPMAFIFLTMSFCFTLSWGVQTICASIDGLTAAVERSNSGPKQ